MEADLADNAETPRADHVITDLWAVRDEHAARLGHNVEAIVQDIGQCRKHLAASVCKIQPAVFAFLQKMAILRRDDARESVASLRLEFLRTLHENGELPERVEPRDRISVVSHFGSAAEPLQGAIAGVLRL